jgi:pilus assembly protein CpaF
MDSPGSTPPPPASRPAAGAAMEAPRPQYIELKANVHRKLLNRLNLEALATADRARAEAEIRTLLFELIAEEGTPLSMTEREVVLGDVIDEVFGLGPLEPLLRDPSVSDILVNTTSTCTSSAAASSIACPRRSRTTST